MNNIRISTTTLKIIAIIAMTINHICVSFFTVLPYNYVILGASIGGITFPIIAYLLVQGAMSTENINKYLLRIFIFWIVSIIPFHLATSFKLVHEHSFLDLLNNVGCTLFFALLMIKSLEKHKKSSIFVKFLIVTTCFVITLASDWGGIGVIIVFSFYQFKNKRLGIVLSPKIISLCIIVLGCIKYFLRGFRLVEPYYLLNAIIRGIGPLIAIPLLMLHEKSKSKPSTILKYLFYIYYPLHFLIIWMFQMIIIE